MNILIATLILAGIPTWQMVQNLEHDKFVIGVINAIQIITYVLLMRATIWR